MTRPPVSPAELRSVAGAFGFSGELLAGAPHGSGHIHDTYLIRCERGPAPGAILQRLNERVFTDIERLMDNIARVTAHQAAKLAGAPDAERRALSILPSRDGARWVRDAGGAAWRAYRWIAGTRSFDALSSPEQARAAARAFARFQREVADLPPPRLHETLPGFHDTPGRLAALVAAARRDAHRRARLAAPEIAFARDHEELAGALHDDWRRAVLAGRVTHNDTKLDNVLFDAASGEPLCVIDLDTVMPGLPLHDFGDLARFALLPAEDERDLTRVQASRTTFTALARGWVEGLGPGVDGDDLSRLATAAQVMTFECGVRFLTDFLDGDVYFKIHRPDQNLDRARAHFALVRALREKDESLRAWAAAVPDGGPG